MAGASPNAFKTGALKSKIMNLAQTSVYQVKIQPPPNVLNFLRTERSLDYTQRGENIELLCHQTTLPGTSFSTTEATNNYTGVTERMVYRRMFDSTIDMTFYVDKAYDVIEFFEGWVDYMSGLGSTLAREEYRKPQAFYRQNYYNDYASSSLFLTKFERSYDRQLGAVEQAEPQKYLEYEMIQAYPKAINSMELGYAQYDSLLTLDVTFGYTRYVRVRR